MSHLLTFYQSTSPIHYYFATRLVRNPALVVLRILPNTRTMPRFQGLTESKTEVGEWNMMAKMTTERATVLILMVPSVLMVLVGMPETPQASPRLQALCLETASPLSNYRTPTPNTHTQLCCRTTLMEPVPSPSPRTTSFNSYSSSTSGKPHVGVFTYGSGQSLELLLGISISSPPAAGLIELHACQLPIWGKLANTLHKQVLCAFCSRFVLVLSQFFMSYCPPLTDHMQNKSTAQDTCAHHGLQDCYVMTFYFLLFEFPLSKIQHESHRESENNLRGTYALLKFFPPSYQMIKQFYF